MYDNHLEGDVEAWRMDGGWKLIVRLPQWVIKDIIRENLRAHSERIIAGGSTYSGGQWDGMEFFIRDPLPEKTAPAPTEGKMETDHYGEFKAWAEKTYTVGELIDRMGPLNPTIEDLWLEWMGTNNLPEGVE